MAVMDNEKNNNNAKKGGSITALFIIVIAPRVMEFPQLIIRPGLKQDSSISRWLLPTHIIINLFCFKGPNKSQ